MKSFKIKILVIGPLPNPSLNKVGGARVSFSFLIEYFQLNKVDFELINTKPFDQGWKRYLNSIIIFFNLIKKVAKADLLMINVSQGGTKFLVPLAFLVSKIFNKKFVFRPFGGSLANYYKNYSSIGKWVFQNTALKADLLILQTKELINYFQFANVETYWLPTSRNDHDIYVSRTAFKNKIIFLGHIVEEKGIDIIIETYKVLKDKYSFEIYGPLKAEKYKAIFKEIPIYKGLLNKEGVLNALAQNDVLILPTFFEGEGYPGVIIEAFSMGLPVIATKWKAIPEIVEHGENGILIPIKSSIALTKAVQSFNISNYSKYSENARRSFLKNHKAEVVTKNLMIKLESLVGK